MADLEGVNKDEENEKQIVENVDFSGCDVCGEDHETEECPILSTGKKVLDATAPSRARLTLPATLEVRDYEDGTTSVITNELITTSTQFGPFEANRTLNFNLSTRFPLKIFHKDGSILHLDTTDERQCNWMALVAPATGKDDMNLIAYQAKEDIYFSTVKMIKPGKELRVWYGPQYCRKMSVTAAWEIDNGSFSENIDSLKEKPSSVKRGVKRKRRAPKHKTQNVYYSGDDDTFDEFESVQSHDEVVQQLDPRRLGFKDTQDWTCSQCGLVFQKCLDFAHHLSDHYKPRQPGARRRDAGIKRPKNFPCDICGQKFTTERLLHKHRMRSHQKILREIRKSQRLQKSAIKDKQDEEEKEMIVENDQNDSAEAETVANIAAELAASGAYHIDEEMQDKSQDNMKLDSGGEETLNEDEMEYPTIPQHDSQLQEDENSQSPSVESNDRRKEPYTCDICHKSFEKSTYLFRHIRKHTGDFTCLKCYKVFARKESMLKHQCSGVVESGDDTNSEYLCTYCNKSFARDHLLRRHLSKHTGEFGCELCGKNYSSKDALMDHSCPKYPEMERYACEICHKTFTKLKYLDKHIPVHTGIFSCAICGKWLRSNDSLINHMRICGLVKELQANGTAICPHCKQEFVDLKTFRRHMYDHTHMFACESCNARFRNKLSLSMHVCDAERAMTCDECGKEFNSIASLNRHRTSHGEPEYSCDTCGRSYYREEALMKHPCERAKRSKGRQSSGRRPPSLMPLICEICGSMFSSTSSLNVHKNLHGEKKFACEVCDKRFHRKDLLLEHMAVHGQPEIPCPVCKKMFKTKKSLDVHLLIHDGVKRFKCSSCDKMFYQKGNLQKHEETHTPGRKHSCPHCNKAFSSKEYLTIHVLEHTRGRIFSCSTCGRSFVKEHQLKAHKRTFHGNQAFVCRFCGLSVKLRHSLKRHLEKKHASIRSEWDSNEQITSMLLQRVPYEESDETLIETQAQETIITEVSPTQGAEVLLAVAGIGSDALQQAIASGAARIQQGPTPNMIEISVQTEEYENAVYSDAPYETGEVQEAQTIIGDVEEQMSVPEEIHIVTDGDEIGASQIVMDDQDQGNSFVLENGTILRADGNGETSMYFYVMTANEGKGNEL